MNLRFAAAGLLIWAASLSLGADREVEELLSKMRSVYSGSKTAHVLVTATSVRFGKNPIKVDLYYASPRKIKAKVDGLPSMRGKTWHYVSDGKRVASDDFTGTPQVGSWDPDSFQMPINLEVMSFWDWKRQLSTTEGSNMEKSQFKLIKGESWNGKKWTVLEETAYGQGVFVRYFIDPSSSLIYRVLVYDLGRTKLQVETVIKKIERNIKVDPKMFEIRVEISAPSRNRVFKQIDG